MLSRFVLCWFGGYVRCASVYNVFQECVCAGVSACVAIADIC